MLNTNANEVFIPEENGNAKAESPIKFYLQFLTIDEQAELEYYEYTHIGSGKNPRVKIKINSAEYFRRGVTKIEGYPDATTAAEWLALRGPTWMARMMSEVALHIKNMMDGVGEPDEKN
jgi:hypothetical protein